jgi:hypothetical protein
MGNVVVGPLARSILDRYRAPGWALLVRNLNRVRGQSTPEPSAPLPVLAEGTIVDERNLARQTVTADGWVAIGVVVRAAATAFLHVNLETGDARVVVQTPDRGAGQPWKGALVPAANFQDLGRQWLSVDGSLSSPAAHTPSHVAVGTYRPASPRVVDAPSQTSWDERLSCLFAALDECAVTYRRTQALLEGAVVVLDLASQAHKPRVPFARRLGTDPGSGPAQPE